jgi:hypothetical protein
MNLQFSRKLRYAEDVGFTFLLPFLTKSAVYLNKSLYIYTTNNKKSLTKTFQNKKKIQQHNEQIHNV